MLAFIYRYASQTRKSDLGPATVAFRTRCRY